MFIRHGNDGGKIATPKRNERERCHGRPYAVLEGKERVFEKGGRIGDGEGERGCDGVAPERDGF